MSDQVASIATYSVTYRGGEKLPNDPGFNHVSEYKPDWFEGGSKAWEQYRKGLVRGPLQQDTGSRSWHAVVYDDGKAYVHRDGFNPCGMTKAERTDAKGNRIKVVRGHMAILYLQQQQSRGRPAHHHGRHAGSAVLGLQDAGVRKDNSSSPHRSFSPNSSRARMPSGRMSSHLTPADNMPSSAPQHPTSQQPVSPAAASCAAGAAVGAFHDGLQDGWQGPGHWPGPAPQHGSAPALGSAAATQQRQPSYSLQDPGIGQGPSQQLSPSLFGGPFSTTSTAQPAAGTHELQQQQQQQGPYSGGLTPLSPASAAAAAPGSHYQPPRASHSHGLMLPPPPTQQQQQLLHQGLGGDCSMLDPHTDGQALSPSLVLPAAAVHQQHPAPYRLQNSSSSFGNGAHLPGGPAALQPQYPAMCRSLQYQPGASAAYAHAETATGSAAAEQAGHTMPQPPVPQQQQRQWQPHDKWKLATSGWPCPPGIVQPTTGMAGTAGLQHMGHGPTSHAGVGLQQQQHQLGGTQLLVQQQHRQQGYGQEQEGGNAGMAPPAPMQQQQHGQGHSYEPDPMQAAHSLQQQQMMHHHLGGGQLLGQQHQQQQHRQQGYGQGPEGGNAGMAPPATMQQQQQRLPLQRHNYELDPMQAARGLPPVPQHLPPAAAAGPHGTVMPGNIQPGYGFNEVAHPNQQQQQQYDEQHLYDQQQQQQYHHQPYQQQQHQQEQQVCQQGYPQQQHHQQQQSDHEHLRQGSNNPLDQWVGAGGMHGQMGSLSLSCAPGGAPQPQQSQEGASRPFGAWAADLIAGGGRGMNLLAAAAAAHGGGYQQLAGGTWSGHGSAPVPRARCNSPQESVCDSSAVPSSRGMAGHQDREQQQQDSDPMGLDGGYHYQLRRQWDDKMLTLTRQHQQ